MKKVVIGYRIVRGLSPEDYDRWLWEVHVPDLLANPFLDRMVYDTVVEQVPTTSGGLMALPPTNLFRLAELHFADEQAYRNYRAWFDDHPLDPARGPAGRTDFQFYVLTDVVEVDRSAWTRGSPNPFLPHTPS
jgi:hypothetical protein